MRDDGVLTTIDIEPEHLRLARQAFAEAGIGPSRTRLISGRPRGAGPAADTTTWYSSTPTQIDQPDYVAEGAAAAIRRGHRRAPGGASGR